MVKILAAVVFILGLMLLLETLLLVHHEMNYGPYEHESAEIVEAEAFCYRKYDNNLAPKYTFTYVFQGKTLSAEDPFVGIFPFEACLLDKLYVIYGREISDLQPGQKITVFLDKNGTIYFGKSNPYLVSSSAFFLFALLIFLIKKHQLFKQNHDE